MRTAVLTLLLAVAARAGGCITVASDRILAGDLAGVDPLFAALDPQLPVGFTPAPGVRRLLTGYDLASIAKRNGLPVAPQHPFSNACVERSAEPIPPERIQEALLAALGIPGAKLELLDYSRQPFPSGRLEFARAGLTSPPSGNPDAPVTWRGRLCYDAARSLAVWARIRVLVERTSWLAAENLLPSNPIRRGQIERVSSEQFPFGPEWSDEREIIGKTPRKAILAGARILAAALDEPEVVGRGDTVLVSVVDGAAHLSFEARALASGRKGSIIAIRNPLSGATFRGVVEDKGKVKVSLEGRP
jgi:flagella basal body P-ring formation protein FlgA